jgi:hypothetical protein
MVSMQDLLLFFFSFHSSKQLRHPILFLFSILAVFLRNGTGKILTPILSIILSLPPLVTPSRLSPSSLEGTTSRKAGRNVTKISLLLGFSHHSQVFSKQNLGLLFSLVFVLFYRSFVLYSFLSPLNVHRHFSGLLPLSQLSNLSSSAHHIPQVSSDSGTGDL